MKQACADGWAAGIEAKAQLERLMGAGAAMVSAGMAWAFTRYSSDYVSQERAAIGARLGIHAHDCMKAWDWRAAQRR